AATLMLRAGVDLHRVQRLLRHSDPRITATIYSHLLAGDLRAGVKAIAPGVVVPEPPQEEGQALKGGANFPAFNPSLCQDPEKRARRHAVEERISNRVAELEQRARRELNPRPSDSKNGNINRADGRHCWILLKHLPVADRTWSTRVHRN